MDSDFGIYDRIAVIELNSPPVNSLSHAMRTQLDYSLEKAMSSPEVDGIILIGHDKHFCGGAALEEFTQPTRRPPTLRTILKRIESGHKPVLAAIHGVALGGGLELALGCHYRVATANAKLGLPEITLGMFPGGGGTQRLPRLVGVGEALNLMLTGKQINGPAAAQIGLIDAILEEENYTTNAINWLKNRLTPPHRTLLARQPATWTLAQDITSYFQDAKKNILPAVAAKEAAIACIECVEASFNLPFEEGLNLEQQKFLVASQSIESQAMRYLFFAERAAKKIAINTSQTTAKAIDQAAVIGAGFMGCSIAISLVKAGVPTYLLDLNEKKLEEGMQHIANIFETMIKKNRLTQEKANNYLSMLFPATNYQTLHNVDIVIEAVTEDMAIKKDVFAQLDQHCKPSTILASNTSRLNIEEIASATQRPTQVVGMHFFSPAHIMHLLEVVKTPSSSDQTLLTVMSFGERIEKLPVLVNLCDGFVGNRMIATYLREANILVDAGVEPARIDSVLVNFGMAMGPFAMMDMVGLDIIKAGRDRLASTGSPNFYPSNIADELCQLGNFGKKSGAGYYLYEANNHTPLPNPLVRQLQQALIQKTQAQTLNITDQEIIERTIYALINEGVKILEEGIATRASDIDLIYIHGYGFPKKLGGPMFYAQSIGLEKIEKTVQHFNRTLGQRWQPAMSITHTLAT